MMEKDKSPDQKKQASHFMAFYVVALFSIALVLILLSYLTQVRADDQIANAENQLQEQVSATQGIQAKMEIIQEAMSRHCGLPSWSSPLPRRRKQRQIWTSEAPRSPSW